MPDSSSLDWNIGQKTIADIGDLRSKYQEVREFVVSPDGEKIAATVKGDDGITACVNGAPWEEIFEKAWCLRFLPTGSLFALVRKDDEWTVGVDGQTWGATFDFVWNPRFSADGKAIAVQIKSGMNYSLAVNGEPWEKTFNSIREFGFSPDGQTAVAAAQVEPLKEGDTDKFFEGVWAIAVNDKLVDGRFLNAWGPTAASGGNTAIEVRTGIREFALMHNGALWPERYGMIWEPCFSPSGSVSVPVRLAGGWTVARDGKVAWEGRYVQVFRLKPDPRDSRVAGVVAPSYGQWTVVVEDKPWPNTWNEAVLDPIFSGDGQRVAAAVRSDGAWSVAVDGQPWSATFDAVWDPVFSPAGDRVAARFGKNGALGIVIDGRISQRSYEMLWDPVFSPDGKKLLVRGVDGGKYVRSVVSVDDL
jgi:hypothetical protein